MNPAAGPSAPRDKLSVMNRATSLVLAVAVTTLVALGACHQTFTPPDQPDLAKVPLQFAGVDLSVVTSPVVDLAVPFVKDLAGPHPDLTPAVDQN